MDPDPDLVCPGRLDPDPVCPERLDPDPVCPEIRIRFVLRSGSGFGQCQARSETLYVSIQNIRLSVYIAARFSPRNRV